MSEKKNYKETLNLPKTDFPMKANLPVREKQILEDWQAKDTYKKVRELRKGKEQFILHDGPPFANGHLHLGHVLNKTLKDVVIRYKTMLGFDAPYIPGWDCHGLPIEHKVVQDLKGDDRNPIRIREESAKYAQKFIDIQKEEFIRLGVWGEWDKPYITMNPEYEAGILRVFADLVARDLVYEGLRPVHWSTGCQTALAEAEIEYQDREDDSIYVQFPVEESTGNWKKELNLNSDLPIRFAVWTTTPWTLPANLGLAVHPDLNYIFASTGEFILIMVESRKVALEALLEKKLTIVAQIKGRALAELEGLQYTHPFLNRQGRVYAADFVTQDTGSGIVHIAPGHGHDDYALGYKEGLAILSPVDDRGCLTSEAGLPELEGVYALKANPLVIEVLKNKDLLIASERVIHSYPHCWRSKTPIIFRSVKQWFIRVDAFKDKALEFIEDTQWIPAWGQKRITGHVSTRQDWCISRQRTWGVPIPVFYDAEGQAILDADIIRKLADRVAVEGTGLWYSESDVDTAQSLGMTPGTTKGKDTLDVWIDSGSSFKSVVQSRLRSPADLYLEGSDQHRGWFQSSLLLAAATDQIKPYKAVLTHGFVVDGDGKKMSKSLGNTVLPLEIMKTLGADILRLWVVSSDYSDDIRVSGNIFDRVSDTYRKFRNTLRYLLGNLNGFDPNKDTLPLEDVLEADRWILSRLARLEQSVAGHYETYQYHRFYQEFYNFCTKDLSSVYFDILKDRLYTDPLTSVSGRSCRTALFHTLTILTKMLAPIMPFTTEEAWMLMIPFEGKQASIHFESWPNVPQHWLNKKLEIRFERMLEIREKVLKPLELMREKKEIGNSLEADVELGVLGEGLYSQIALEAKNLEGLCLVSHFKVTLTQGTEQTEDYIVKASKSPGHKCDRCWKHLEEVGQTENGDLCLRCTDAVKGIEWQNSMKKI